MKRHNIPEDSEGPGNALNRRRMLQLSALGGGALLAGCSDSPGGGDETPGNGTQGPDGTSPPDDLDDVDADMIIPTARAMEEIHFFNIDMSGTRNWQKFTRELGAYGEWVHPDYIGRGELNYRLYENVELTENELTIKVRDDARWSDGSEITGKDAIVRVIEARVHASAMPLADVGDKTPKEPVNAVTGFEYDGKTATLKSEGGYFGPLIDQTVWRELLVKYGVLWPTDVGEYTDYADEVFGLMEQAVNGEADPWAEGTPQPPLLVNEVYQSDRDPIHNQYRDADNGDAVVCGAWVPAKRQDSRLILEPNEQHRHYEDINYERIILEMATNTDQIWSAIQNQRYAFAAAEPPSYVAEGFPDTYQAAYAPDDDGVSIVCNFEGPNALVSKPRVRQAIMTALDQPAVCEQLHPRVWEAIDTPGDTFGQPGTIDDGWWDQLHTYGQDQGQADELMAMAEGNYERNSNGWFADSSGEVATLQIHTSNPVPQTEPLLVQQLKDWGIKAEFTTLEGALMESEQNDGALTSWIGNFNAGSCFGSATAWGYNTIHKNVIRRTGWYKGNVEDNIEETPWDEEGFLRTNDPEQLDHLVVEAPPIGEFMSDERQEYPVVSMTKRLEAGLPEAVEEDWPKLIWVTNWLLHGIPISISKKQYFVNTDNWYWPTDHEAWQYAGVTTNLGFKSFVGWGDQVYANPDNPPSQ